LSLSSSASFDQSLVNHG